MYIHIGEDLNIRLKDIIAILDKDSTENSESMEEFFQYHQKEVINLSKKRTKSIVITVDKIYLSPIASGTLKKRSSQMYLQEF
ncbi:DUF370 domain-containing protein [Neobacillus sedimentimangrovi]|jgi:extracellular matrix regulatory protein B|uniref:DUF370 domain-containing protein n=1 Tax=Neobacillus sedimentimangrovi TaxID=2699460 RepID=A0ABS8QKS2_9BACI|nr:extracellular matrix/biofilm biosynthesis regulator RemA family protein [Neobacillus sedimentimangrovi]MCD4839867.1 DUF370 domain-containing protein [Neobacillus sedimentimangrovi]